MIVLGLLLCAVLYAAMVFVTSRRKLVELETPRPRGLLWKIQNAQITRPKIPRAVRRAVLDRDGRRCRNCGGTSDLSLDHIYPWSLGGSDEADNLQTLCRPCNSRKGARV